MFNRMQFNSILPEEDNCEECARVFWEYLLSDHTQTNPVTDFGSLMKEIRQKLEKEKSRILLQ